MAMNKTQWEAFNKRLEQAVEKAQADLRPLFEAIGDGNVYQLDDAEADLIHEVAFKLGMFRSVIVHHVTEPDTVHGLWLAAKARRARDKEGK